MKGLLKQKRDNGAQRQPGKPLVLYLLPGLLVGLVTLFLLAVLAHQVLSRGADEQARQAMSQAATTLVAGIREEVRNRADRLRFLAAAQPGLAQRVAQGMSAEALREETARLRHWLPGTLAIRLLPAGWQALDPLDKDLPAPLGFAGVEMLRRVVASGKVADAEVHQAGAGRPYIALAAPLFQDRQVVGALMVAYPYDSLTTQVQAFKPVPGLLRLEQKVEDKHYVLAELRNQAVGDGDVGDAFHVPGTIWQVSFITAPQYAFGLQLLPFLGFVLLGMLPLLLAYWLQLRMLRRAVRHDMKGVVEQIDALVSGRDIGPLQAILAEIASLRAHLGTLVLNERRNRGGQISAEQPADQDKPPTKPLAETVDIPEVVFRAYDIRGVANEQLTPAFAQRLGLALAGHLYEKDARKVVVGRDVRKSSPRLQHNLIEGLTRGGCDVLDLGMAPTPLVYFAQHAMAADAAVVVTGSHNPGDENGFKIVVGSEVLAGEQLAALRPRMLQPPEPAARQGVVESCEEGNNYIARVIEEITLARPMTVVVDAGNGAAGPLAVQMLETLGCEVFPLFCEPDGNFPNHHPDPSSPGNLAPLMLEVQARGADVGLAFDGDGDRLGVIDSAGHHVWPDRVLMLLARDVLTRHPGSDILYDVKCSRHVGRFVLASGGRPIMGQSGHARMRARMNHMAALLGGEFSGHFFISERWYGFDDALYAAARVLEVLAADPRSSSEQFAEIPDSPSTPEYYLPLAEGENVRLLERLARQAVFEDAEVVTLDGLRIEFVDGWALVRASNTTASLAFRFEADSEEALERIRSRIRDWLKTVRPEQEAPF